MLLLRLYYEFFKVGLFSVGGGLATIPFLQDMALRTGWFTNAALADMIAISESTPGAMGVNMATYVGFETAGIPGAVIASLGLVSPSLIVILIIARVLEQFRNSKTVQNIFFGLRPASLALITAAGLSVAAVALFRSDDLSPASMPVFHPASALVAVAVFVLIKWTPLQRLHPIFYILAAGLIGVIFQF